MTFIGLTTLAFYFSALISIGIIIIVWPRRHLPGAWAFLWMNAAIALFSFASGVEYQSTTLANNLLWGVICYPGVLGVPLSFFFFVTQYTGHQRYLTRSRKIILFGFTGFAMLSVLTNEWHHLYWSSLTPDPVLGESLIHFGHGPLFFITVTFLYVLLLGGSVLLLRMFFNFHSTYRRQALGILIAVPLPWLSNIFYIFEIGPFKYIDTTPIFFSIASLILALNIYYFKLLDLTPIAREIIFDNLQEGVVVTDHLNRIIDINSKGRRFLTQFNSLQIGQNVFETLPDLKKLYESDQPSMEYHPVENPSAWLEMRLSPLISQQGENIGRLLIIEDISGRKNVELELQKKSKEMEQLAISDMLTGLYNRRYFDNTLANEFERSNRYKETMALALCDLDNFKQINDRFGHGGGDKVLKMTGQVFSQTKRSTDVVARMGGDEIVVLFPHTSLEEARAALERIQQKLCQITIEGIGCTVTMSAGVTLWHPGDTPDSALQRADHLLYRAKDLGRNRIEIDKPQE